MKNKRSFGLLNGTSLVLMFGIASLSTCVVNVWSPMMQSLSEKEITLFLMYLTDLVMCLVGTAALYHLMMNIRGGRFFVKPNYICFRILGTASLLPLVAHVAASFFCGETVLSDWIMALLPIGSFMFVMAEIFRSGYVLSEEQKLIV